jgi:RNA polymerase I-specific transcription initiation factor RRN3
VCLPSIVDEFCRQAEAACLFTSSEEFIFNYSLESEHSRAFGGIERLDMFFPFDPCLLKKSDRYTFLALGFIYLIFFLFYLKGLAFGLILLGNSDTK